MVLEPCTLRGAWVRLEPLASAHVEQLAAIAFDDELWRWTSSRITTRDDLERYVTDALTARDAGTALPFVTVEAATNQIVGSTRFANADLANRRVEIGWTFVARPWQRTRINTEAKHLMLRHAFERLKCIRVELKTDALNTKSRNAIERIGAVEEGTLRNHMIVAGGRIRDTVYFSIIEAEWPAVANALREKLTR